MSWKIGAILGAVVGTVVGTVAVVATGGLAAPLVLGAVAASTATGVGAAGVGAAVGAAAGAAVGAAAGGATVAVTTAVILGGAAVILSGIVITTVLWQKIEDAETKGMKRGIENSSKEYGEKLVAQAKAHDRITKDLEEKIKKFEGDKLILKGEREEWVIETSELYGELKGHIKARKEIGATDEELKEILEEYKKLEKVMDEIRKAKG
jgi:hypothetical protein